MTYQVSLERLPGGRYRARCDAGAEGLLAGEGPTPAAAVEQLEKELRYRLELCPCSHRAAESLRIEVRQVAGGAPSRR